jgi:hypothetical protein
MAYWLAGTEASVGEERLPFTLQSLPVCDEPYDDGVGKVAGFSLHAGVAARADERKKLERLCLARATSPKRLMSRKIDHRLNAGPR